MIASFALGSWMRQLNMTRQTACFVTTKRVEIGETKLSQPMSDNRRIWALVLVQEGSSSHNRAMNL